MIQGWIYSKNADLAIFVVSLKLGLKVRTIRWDKEKNKRPHKVQAHAGHEFVFLTLSGIKYIRYPMQFRIVCMHRMTAENKNTEHLILGIVKERRSIYYKQIKKLNKAPLFFESVLVQKNLATFQFVY